MEIKMLNKHSWQIKAKKELILIDPESEDEKSKKGTYRMVLYTKKQLAGSRLEEDGVVKIAGPGEYEVGGIEVTGINGGEDGRIYTIVVEGVIVGVLGSLKGMPTEKKLQKINSLDVMVIDAGEENGLDAKQILELAKDWGANYLIPVGADKNNQTVKNIMDETDKEGMESVASVKIEKDNLPENMALVILE